MRKITALLLLTIAAAAFAANPTKTPTSNPTDDILAFGKPAATAPSSETQPALGKSPVSKDDEDAPRTGTIELSDGTKIHGKIVTTAEKPVRIWVESQKAYQDYPIEMIASAQAVVNWERQDPEWNFKETGSDVKVYSGKTYPARETEYKLTMTDGTTVQGATVAPFYVTTDDGKTTTYVLHKRDKGAVGKTLKDLVYVKTVTFDR
jgi:hypothetical protein